MIYSHKIPTLGHHGIQGRIHPKGHHAKGLRLLLIRDSPRGFSQRHGPDVQLLDLVDGADDEAVVIVISLKPI